MLFLVSAFFTTLIMSSSPHCPVLSPTSIWLTNYTTVDNSSPTKAPLLIDDPIVELVDGEHLDWLLQNLDASNRPNSLIAFVNSSIQACSDTFENHEFHTLNFPRKELLLAFHDISKNNTHTWYISTPEMDVPRRFGLEASDSCIDFVFVSRECDGLTEWCVKEEIQKGVHRIGCDEFKSCEKFRPFLHNGDETFKDWVQKQVDYFGVPLSNGQHSAYQQRTQTTITRNAFIPPMVPKFSPEGFKIMKIPDMTYKMLTDFQNQWHHKRYDEGDVFGIIKGAKTFMVSLDNNITFRQNIATQHIQPILEEWSGLELKFESFYGVREYQEGSMLRNHIDRLATHVISATMNVGPLGSESHWPLEFITHNGIRLRYNHPPGYMVLYESTSLIHGRPYPLPKGAGPHFGAFIHFSPTPWKYEHLQDSISDNTKRANENSKKDAESQYQVEFHNKASKAIDVYWKNAKQSSFVMTVEAKSEKVLNTFRFHTFFILPSGRREPKLATFTMKKSQRIYTIDESMFTQLRF